MPKKIRYDKIIRAKSKKEKNSEPLLIDFLKNYGNQEPSQDAAMATFDNQIKSIITTIATTIGTTAVGTIIDVGCGSGVLLQRLAELPIFIENKGWTYLGIDYYEHKKEIIDLAFEHGVHKQLDFKSIEDFYSEWPVDTSFSRPHIIFCRNVLHELDTAETSSLLFLISQNMKEDECLIIQDLQVFPKAEKGNVCWSPEKAEALIRECGFKTILTTELSTSGNRWFNIIARRTNSQSLTKENITSRVINSRTEQWNEWNNLGALHLDDEKFRDVRISKIDFDLQFASLTKQLILANATGIKPLTPSQEALVLKEAFIGKLHDFKIAKPKSMAEAISSVPYFVNRGNSKDALETFLVSKYSFTIIQGSPFMGKTELVKEVLSSFHHDRLPVLVDIQATSSVWNIIEQILSSIRCTINSEVLSTLKNISFENIKDELLEFIERVACDTIFVFDHIERILNPGGVRYTIPTFAPDSCKGF